MAQAGNFSNLHIRFIQHLHTSFKNSISILWHVSSEGGSLNCTYGYYDGRMEGRDGISSIYGFSRSESRLEFAVQVGSK